MGAGGSWRQRGGKQGHAACAVVCRSSGDFLLEEQTAIGLIYISAASVTAAYVDPRQGVGYGKLGIAVVFPARPRRAGRAGCRVCRAAGRTGAAWKQAPIPPHKLRECERLQQEHMSLFFLSDFR